MSTSAESEATELDEKPPIQLSVKVESPEPCLRSVVVTIPKSEVDRYMQDAYDELVHDAQVPGFRAGRAPRKLVEKQFRDRIVDQVKGSLVMDSLGQVSDEQNFSAIGEPNFDYNSIEIPEAGDFIYQFTIEVRPEFKTPDWKGLTLTRPVEEVTDTEIDASINRVLARYGSLEATDEPAALGDKLLITATFSQDGKTLTEMDEERITLQKKLSFSDGTCDDFGKLMEGVTEGETRKGKVTIGDGVVSEEMRGKTIDASFQVIEVFKQENPELTPAFLEELGDFESEQELRDFVRDSLERQANYRTEQAVRKLVVEALAGSVDFQLPQDLVRRQTNRELERKVLELRRSGFDEDSLRRFVNASRQNAQASTEASLREHFVLEQIAEEEKIEADPSDYDHEIQLIAEQSDMPERRVRARLEKSGQMDALRNQIVERKVIEKVAASAKVTDEKVKQDADEENEFAVYHNVLPTKDDAAIPEAKHEDNVSPNADKDKKDKD